MGIPPTGNQTGVSGIIISRVSEGKLVEDWNIWDTLGLMRQLGVVPEPGGESMEHSHWVGEGERRSPMSTEENKALSNRVAEAIGNGDLDALDGLMVPELAEEFKREVAEMRRAFPDYAGTNVEQIAEAEKVANRFVFLGTHLGEFEGVAPTGKRVEFIGHSIDGVADGKIVESRIEVDMLGVMQQLGAVPEPGQSEEASFT